MFNDINFREEETMIFLRETVAELPTKERAVVALRAAGFTQKECGLLLGLTRAAIGAIYKRAIIKVKQIFYQDEEEEYAPST